MSEITTVAKILILIENHPLSIAQRMEIRTALRHAAIKDVCVRGHKRIPANLDSRKGCLPCKAEWRLEPCPNCLHVKGEHTADGCRHRDEGGAFGCDCVSVRRQYVADDIERLMGDR